MKRGCQQVGFVPLANVCTTPGPHPPSHEPPPQASRQEVVGDMKQAVKELLVRGGGRLEGLG